MMIKALFIILGTLSLGLGILGIIIPGLPTTPFVLLTAGLYARSSKRLHNWMVNHRAIGPYILRYRRNKGLTKREKLYAIIMMWAMILISGLLFITSAAVHLILLAAGITGTVVMGWIVPSAKPHE